MGKAFDLAMAYGLPPDLFEKQIMVESGGNPRAVSPAGAMGLGQLMPAIQRQYNVTDPFDEDQNLHGSAQYMRDLVSQYGGNYGAALAHYNGGTRAGKAVMAGQEPPQLETRNYINKIQGGNMDNFPSYQQQLLNPLDVEIKRSMLPNAKEYAQMNAEKVERLPLAMAAMLSGDKRISALGATLFKDGNAAQSPDKLSAYMSLNPDGSILQVGDQAKAAQMARGKQIPFGETTKLSDQGNTVDVLGGLASTFKDNYAGVTPSATAGEVENWAARRFSSLGMQDQGNWWQQYNEQANKIRHDLFGSALTAGEQAAFERANIDPGMDPADIKKRLAEQQSAAASAYNKIIESAGQGGWDVSGQHIRQPLTTPMSMKGTNQAPPPAPGASAAAPGEVQYDMQGRRIK